MISPSTTSSSAGGTRVVLPAPGGAARTRAFPARRAATTSGRMSSTGSLMGQLLVLDAVGRVGVGAERLFPPGGVVLVVPLEPGDLAVPFERQDVGGDPVEEPAVVA